MAHEVAPPGEGLGPGPLLTVVGQPGAPTPEDARPASSVPLDRLLRVAILTPAQAEFVAAGVLDSLAREHAEGVVAGGLGAADVLVDVHGRVRLTRPDHPTDPDDAEDPYVARSRDLDGMLRVVAELGRNARSGVAHPGDAQEEVLARLGAVGAGDFGGAAQAAERLGASTDSEAAPRLRAQLAALAGAFERVDREAAPVPPRPVPARAEHSGSTRETTPVRATRSWHSRGGGGRLRLVAALVVGALVVAAAVVFGVGPGRSLFGGSSPSGSGSGSASRGGSGTGQHQSAGHHHAHASGNTPAVRRAVPRLAPAAAGAVQGVQLAPAGPCDSGATCLVKVTVKIDPAPTVEPVRWRVGTVRRCGESPVWGPVTAVDAQPGWTTVYATSTVHVPRGRAPALVAVTRAPAGAQSRAVFPTGHHPHC
ncbi:MAG: hypothetical protein ACRDPH_05955 [Marmoricola sp.]